MMEEKKGKPESGRSQATPEQGASYQDNSMEAIMKRYAEEFKEDIKNNEPFPGIRPDARAKLREMEAALSYNDEVMKTRCNS